jgi:hypothetical protein
VRNGHLTAAAAEDSDRFTLVYLNLSDVWRPLGQQPIISPKEKKKRCFRSAAAA